jgi:hypothetical protein
VLAPIPLVILATCIWIFVARFWQRAEDTRRLKHALIAALVGNGTAGIWAVFAAPLFPSYEPASLTLSRGGTSVNTLIGITLLLALMSFGPNLLGMAMISTVLVHHRRWLRACQRGGFIPAGIAYGLGVLLASVFPLLLPVLLIGRVGDLLALLAVNFFYATAGLSGITAVGIYSLLERPAEPRIRSRVSHDVG